MTARITENEKLRRQVAAMRDALKTIRASLTDQLRMHQREMGAREDIGVTGRLRACLDECERGLSCRQRLCDCGFYPDCRPHCEAY